MGEPPYQSVTKQLEFDHIASETCDSWLTGKKTPREINDCICCELLSDFSDYFQRTEAQNPGEGESIEELCPPFGEFSTKAMHKKNQRRRKRIYSSTNQSDKVIHSVNFCTRKVEETNFNWQLHFIDYSAC